MIIASRQFILMPFNCVLAYVQDELS